MRITIDIDDKSLRELQRYTGLRKKSPAVGVAVAEYLRRQKVDAVFRMVNSGEVDFEPMYQRIKQQREDDAHRCLRLD